MPRILQINIRVNKGSVSRITEQIGQKIIEQGWESYIAYGRPSNPSKSKLIRIGSNIEVKIHYILSQITGRHGHFSTFATKRLVKQIQKLKPDIIHLQNIQGYYLNYIILFEFLNKTDIPLVWTMHSCWPFTGKCPHFVTVGCSRWLTECHHCPLKHSYPRSLFFDFSREDYILKKELFSGNRNLHIVPVSHWLEGLVRQSYLKNKDIRVIHNGVDLNVFYPRPIRSDVQTQSNYESNKNYDEILTLYNRLLVEKKFIILGVATSWSDEKGLKDYITLSRIISDDYQIVLVGIAASIKKELPENIMCLPKTDNVNILAFIYSIADVVTSLSYTESLGMTPIEGMACGTPSIVYDNTAQPELVDKKCGIIIPTGDIRKLQRALDEIRRNGKHFYSEACVARVRKMYDKEERYNDYIELYRELCEQKN